MLKPIFSKIKDFLKKLKPERKDLTYEEFINLEGKKFQRSEYSNGRPQTPLDHRVRYRG